MALTRFRVDINMSPLFARRGSNIKAQDNALGKKSPLRHPQSSAARRSAWNRRGGKTTINKWGNTNHLMECSRFICTTLPLMICHAFRSD